MRIAAGRAAARLLPQQPSLAPGLSTILMALLGPDQSSEVQRQALMALKRAAGDDAGAALFEPLLDKLLPSICAIVQNPQNNLTKVAAEACLKKLLRLEAVGEALAQRCAGSLGSTVRTTLTEAYLKRLMKLAEEEDFGADDF